MLLTEPIPRVFQAYFDSHEDLCMSFLRFQEFYESPEFAGKVFSHAEFREWYIANSPAGKETGNFTYYDDWGGFNIPSYVLGPFYGGDFDPLTDLERNILQLFEDEVSKFYVVDTSLESREEDVKHELSHGLYYVNDEYKESVDAVIASIFESDRERLGDFIKSHGYGDDTLVDEMHAYLLASPHVFAHFNFDLNPYDRYIS